MDPQGLHDDPKELFAAMSSGNPSLPVPKFLTPSTTQRLARERSKDIFSDRDALLNILERYEETLRKRWAKKTTEQRRKVLLRSYPNMPAMHRPDFEALRRETPDQVKAGTRFYDSFLLPSLNLEDLLKPKTLLMFLHSRGRQDPDVFANFDFNSIHLASAAQAIIPAYTPGYTMLLIGQKSPFRYGHLIPWDDDTDAWDMLSTGAGIRPGEGLLTMEIQQRKLSFLRTCAEAILQGLPLQDTTVSTQPPPPDFAPSLKDRSEDSEWPSLSKEILEAPYRVPDQFDMGRLQSFINAKRDEAADHIWFLREDPSYFKGVILDWSEHRQEKILSVNGGTHPILRRDTFWERVLGNVVVDAYLTFLSWEELRKFVDELERLREKYADRISPTSHLPREYEEDEIERMLRNDSKSRERVSPWVAKILSSLSLLGELKRQNGLLRPGPITTELLEEEELNEEFSNRFKLFARIHTAFQKDFVFSEIATPLSKFNYPSDKRLDVHNTLSLQEAERNLDAFWKSVDEQFLKKDGKSLHTLLAGVLPQRDLRRTADWTDEDDHVTIGDGLPQNLSAKAALLDLESRTEETLDNEVPKPSSQKIKTRGVAAVSQTTEEQPTQAPAAESPTFTVSKRGFKVSSTLFHRPTREDPPAEVPWSEFLSAMASVGFSIRKLDGSAWVFEPLSDLFRRSIIFHEPHPTNKIPYQTARRYGRRLERAYGLTGASFSRG